METEFFCWRARMESNIYSSKIYIYTWIISYDTFICTSHSCKTTIWAKKDFGTSSCYCYSAVFGHRTSSPVEVEKSTVVTWFCFIFVGEGGVWLGCLSPFLLCVFFEMNRWWVSNWCRFFWWETLLKVDATKILTRIYHRLNGNAPLNLGVWRRTPLCLLLQVCH